MLLGATTEYDRSSQPYLPLLLWTSPARSKTHKQQYATHPPLRPEDRAEDMFCSQICSCDPNRSSYSHSSAFEPHEPTCEQAHKYVSRPPDQQAETCCLRKSLPQVSNCTRQSPTLSEINALPSAVHNPQHSTTPALTCHHQPPSRSQLDRHVRTTRQAVGSSHRHWSRCPNDAETASGHESPSSHHKWWFEPSTPTTTEVAESTAVFPHEALGHRERRTTT